MDLSADRIITHRKHRSEEGYTAPAKRKADLAILVRDRVAQKIEEAGDGEELDAILFTKAGQGALSAGMRAQSLLDKRENQSKKNTQADMLVALLGALRGDGAPPVLLADPNVIEGEAVVVE